MVPACITGDMKIDLKGVTCHFSAGMERPTARPAVKKVLEDKKAVYFLNSLASAK